MSYFTRSYEARRGVVRVPGLLSLVWIGVGLVVAATHDYFQNVDTFKRVLSAVLAVLLWPLLLFGVDINLADAG